MRSRSDAIEVLIGLGLIVGGVAFYSRPAAAIVAGLALVLSAFVWGRR